MHAAACWLIPHGCCLRWNNLSITHWNAGPVCLIAGMYYGGEPVEWTDSPAIPHEARYEVMNKPPPAPKAAAAAGASAGAAAAASGGGGSAARPAGQQQYAVAGSRVVNKHPLADVRLWGAQGGAWDRNHARRPGACMLWLWSPPGALPMSARTQLPDPHSPLHQNLPYHPLFLTPQLGGYQLHSIEGSVGGAKGVGTLHRGGGGNAGAPAGSAAAAADAKRKRDGEAGGEGGAGGKGQQKELTKEEREFMARREAARQRVQQRTAASFGLV